MDAPGAEERIAALLARRHEIGQAAVPPSRSDHLYSRGDPGGALLYSALFAPELAEVEGCVLLKDLGAKPAAVGRRWRQGSVPHARRLRRS